MGSATTLDPDNPTVPEVPQAVTDSEFCRKPAPTPLRVCCYGSSSSLTPERYRTEARSLGYILARRGHTCVNGAGSFGCMAAMNEGAALGNGHIVGVIHEMWLVDSSDWADVPLRDGGAHPVFERSDHRDGPTREMLVAGGDDLQERKKLLVQGADALVVLPGGPGTWDELWEMACGRNIGLHALPIVCVNVDGYYEPFQAMLQRAYDDQLTKLPPHEIVHFEDSAEAAVRWVENAQRDKSTTTDRLRHRNSALRQTSVLHGSLDESDSRSSWIGRSLSRASEWATEQETWLVPWVQASALLTVGGLTGFLLATKNASKIA